MVVNDIKIQESIAHEAKVKPVQPVREIKPVREVKPVEQKTNSGNDTTKDQKGSRELLKKEIEEVNHKLKLFNRHCVFKYIEDVDRVAITVIDSETDEVVKEIPGEDALEMMKRLREMSGLVIDEQR